MYYVYVIDNEKGTYYIGVTSNIDERLKKHNHFGSEWTKRKGPWRLVIKEEFEDKKEALRRERQIKSYKGGNAFKKLIQQNTKADGPATAEDRNWAGPLANRH